MQYVERNSRISDFLYFEDWMLYQKNRSSELLEEAVKAMQEDTFQLYIQPQFQLSDEKIISGEALSRWFLEDGSCVPPDLYIFKYSLETRRRITESPLQSRRMLRHPLKHGGDSTACNHNRCV